MGVSWSKGRLRKPWHMWGSQQALEARLRRGYMLQNIEKCVYIYIYVNLLGTLRASCLATFCLRYLPLRFGFVPSAVGVSGLHEGDLGIIRVEGLLCTSSGLGA